MPRKPIIPIRADEETKARWQEAADEHSTTLAEFIRAAVEEKIAGGAQPSGLSRPTDSPTATAYVPPGGKVFKGPDPKGGKSRR